MIEIHTEKRGNIITDLMPDLTPLLDIMFMLMVFFILTANAVPYALDVNLPEDSEAVTNMVEDSDMLSVTLLPDDKGWKINETTYKTEKEFKETLKVRAKDNKRIIIIGDKNVSMQKLLAIMVFLRKNNIETADIIMDKK